MNCTKKDRLAYTKQAQEILDTLTLTEKISLMSGSMTFEEVRGAIKKKTAVHYNQFPYPSGGIPEKGIPPMLFCDGPRGVVCGKNKSTCFPVSMLRGASFDTELEEKIGNAVAEEVLAYGGNLFAGVCINLPYNPGWGRSQETYGEDSFLLGEMGAALTRGVQNHGVIACVKHFAFNQMENSRFTVNIECSKRTEQEVFLPHFKKCIDAGAAAVMTSYNLYKGIMCGHNGYLLNKVLKTDWDFDGFLMSDFVWGVKDTVAAANGGQTMEMCVTKYYGDLLVKAVQNGQVKESIINDAALRIIRTLIAFSHYQDKPERGTLGCGEHRQLALESAREGITLIQNTCSILPLDRNVVKRIAVLGKLANQELTGDRGSSQVYPPYVVTPLDGIIKAAPDAEIVYYDGKDLNHAVKLAESADAVIFVCGYDYNDEGEFVAQDKNDVYTEACGGDRTQGLCLHSDETVLIQTAGKVNSNSVVVLIGGNTIMMEEWKKSVSSILIAYYPGMEGGTALAEIIFGDVNPSGKLPYVIPQKESDLPQVSWDTDYQFYDYYHGYAKLEKEKKVPAVPFGFGLSYTTFEIMHAKAWLSNDMLMTCCDIKNTGDREGCELVQLYVGFSHAEEDRPVKLLKGFKRINLQEGEKRTVIISCSLQELAWFNEASDKFEIDQMEYEIYLGTSSDPGDLLKTMITVGHF